MDNGQRGQRRVLVLSCLMDIIITKAKQSKAQRQAHSDAHIDTHIHSHIHTHSVVKLKKQFNFIATQIDTKKKPKRWKPGKRVEMEVSNCEYFDYI